MSYDVTPRCPSSHTCRCVAVVISLAFALLAFAPGAATSGGDDAPNPAALVARADSLDAVIDELITRERYVTAFGVAAEQARLREKAFGPRARPTLASLHRIAEISHLSGDQETAARFCNMAFVLRESELGCDHPDVAESLVLMAMIAKYSNRFEDTLAFVERGIDICELHPEIGGEILASFYQARANVMRRRYIDGGIPDYERALQIRRDWYAGPALPLADSITWLAWALMQVGRHAEAMHLVDEAEAQLRALGLTEHSLMGVIIAMRAEEHAVAERWHEADELYQKAIPIFANAQSGYFPGFSRRRLPLNASETHALVLLKLGRWEDAFLAKQKFASDIQRDFTANANWPNAAPVEFERVQNLQRELIDVCEVLGEGSLPKDNLDLSRITDRRIRLQIEKVRLTAEIRACQQQYLLRDAAPYVSVADVQRCLTPESAFMGVVKTRIADYHSSSTGAVHNSAWIYVIRHTGNITWVPVYEARTTREYQRQVVHVLKFNDMIRRRPAWQAFGIDADDEAFKEASRRSTDVLLSGVLPHLEGVETLIMEFSSLFEMTPFECLLDSTNTYLSDRFATSYVPSSTFFVKMHRRDRQDDSMENLFAVANPDFCSVDTTFVDGLLSDAQMRALVGREEEALEHIPPLRFSEEEVRRIEKMFPTAKVLLGPDASEPNLWTMARTGELMDYDVLHFATHALTDPSPELGAMAMARNSVDGTRANDGFVETAEILLAWRLDADLVTLSACQTARAVPTDGRLLGFATALLGVGARSVLGSMWKVNDRATSLFMARFYENLTGWGGADPMTKAAALAEARKWLRNYVDENGDRPYADPSYWGAFILIGLPD